MCICLLTIGRGFVLTIAYVLYINVRGLPNGRIRGHAVELHNYPILKFRHAKLTVFDRRFSLLGSLLKILISRF